MKLNRFFIDYRVLGDLDILFGPAFKESKAFSHSPEYSLDFLVGVNGTGKSTVLKILFELFSLLERQAPIPFPFEIEYEIGKGEQKKIVKISNCCRDTDSETPQFKQTPDIWQKVGTDREYEQTALSSEILPNLVIGFTTGSENSWLTKIQNPLDYISADVPNLSPLELAFRELPGKPTYPFQEEDNKRGESRCLFISGKDIPIITLCGLLTDLGKSQQRLAKILQTCKIERLSGFALKFRKLDTPFHDWKKVEQLAQLTSKRLRVGTDYQLIFDLADKNLPQKFIETYYSGFELFKILSQLAQPDVNGQKILQSVQLFLERPTYEHPETESETPMLHLFDWFSDGEKSFLGRMSLLTLLETQEALILLDEPEVHFNDFWKRQIVYLIDEALAKQSSHLLITTHSSITLTDVPQKNIVILDRSGNSTDNAFSPSINTFAANPSDIMVHVFGSPYPSGELSINRVETQLAKKYKDKEKQKQDLEDLQEIIAPGYWSFLIRQELHYLKKEPQK